jgi:biopolymer transport protein ExbD
MASLAAREGEFGLQIAPMLGLSLALLLIALLCAVARVAPDPSETSISTQLPFSGSHGLYVKLFINADDSVSLNGVCFDAVGQSGLPITKLRLKALLAENRYSGVMIQPQPTTRQQRLVDVITSCRSAGFKDIEFGQYPQPPVTIPIPPNPDVPFHPGI